MNVINYPIFESPIVLFETEQAGEYAGVFEGNNFLVKLNNDYPDKTKYSVYFLNGWFGMDELPMFWEIDYR